MGFSERDSTNRYRGQKEEPKRRVNAIIAPR